jgi:outer membrane protein assembly factor BamD (BamD/ComL family)
MNATILSLLFLILTLSVLAFHKNSAASANIDSKREQELFLAGANAVSEGQFDKGRILLMTMIYTYPDSPLVEQAKLVIFYSHAREGGTKNEKAAKLLHDMEEQMKTYAPKQKDQ